MPLLLAAACAGTAPGPSIDGHVKSPGEVGARQLAGLVRGKFAYVGISGTASHYYEVSGPGLSHLVAVDLDQEGRVVGGGVDPLTLLHSGPASLWTTG